MASDNLTATTQEIAADEDVLESEDDDASLSISYVLLRFVPPTGVALLLSKPLLGSRLLAGLGATRGLFWVELVALSAVVFAAVYVATRHRYSFTFSAAAATFACLAVYFFGHLYAPKGVVGSTRFLVATRWTLWALPLALACWTRAVLVAGDEALDSGQVPPEGPRKLVELSRRWRARRLFARRARVGYIDLALYVVLSLLSAVVLLHPTVFLRDSPGRDAWEGWIYQPTKWGTACAAAGLVWLFALTVFISIIWLVRPTDIALHDEARLHLVAAASWLALFGSTFGLDSAALWPKPFLDLAFAAYFFGFSAAMVHSAVTQERVRRHTTLQRRVFGSAGTVAFGVVAAAIVLSDRPVRAGALSCLVVSAFPLAPLVFRALFGFERPPTKNEEDEVKAVEVDELEEVELAQRLRDVMAVGEPHVVVRSAAIDAMRTFAAGLNERDHASAKPRQDADPGHPSSDIRRAINGSAAIRREMGHRIEALPAFSGTAQERLVQLAELIHRTADHILIDPRGTDIELAEAEGPPTRIELFIAYSVQKQLFNELGDISRQRELRYVYRAWRRAHGSWHDLLVLNLDELRKLAGTQAPGAGLAASREVERRRKLSSRQLDLAAADIKARWLENLRKSRESIGRV
ncbi:MAG TPA: hypothetical protein VF101_04035 [Gaiellaceae bacterium]